MNNSVGLLIGGLAPAVAFGVGALFQKQSNDIGIGQTNYLLYFSGGLIIASFIAYFIFSENHLSHKAGIFAIGHGIFFSVGFICHAMGLTIYQIPVSKLVPLVKGFVQSMVCA